MAVELEWRFEDEPPDETWRDKHPPRRLRWPVWLGLGGAVLLLVGVGFYAWWHARRETLARIEAEVQAVARLELRALAEGDTELYLSLQDDADPVWRGAYDARAALDTLLPAPLPGMTATAALSVENARVVGDTARVEVVRMAGSPGGEMVPFRAIRFYCRTDDGRWLHTRPDLDYAGHTVLFVGEQVKIASFAIDADWMSPVAAQLEGLARQFCSLVSCRRRTPLALVFTGTLDSAVELESVLLAPFLVGVPDDAAARTAWEARLYELFIDRLIAREAEQPVGSTYARGEPRGGELFYARVREWLRAKLGLSEPVFPDLDVIAGALDGGEWISLEALWAFTPADDDPRRPLAEAEIDLLLAFIEEEYGSSLVVNLLYAPRQARRMEPLIWDALHGGWPAFEHRYVVYARQVTGRSVESPGELGRLTLSCPPAVPAVRPAS
jgi:hypothetical protein